MSETKINASQTTITANDIGAAPVYDTMPTAAVGYLDKIVQYVGATDASYTNGYFYKCVSDGASTPTYSWTAVSVQAGGGSSLPSQTGNSGKFLTTDGTDASWGKALENRATGSWGAIATAYGSSASGTSGIAIGYNAKADGYYSIAIGRDSIANGSNSVAINGDNGTYNGAVSIKGQAKGDRAIGIGGNAIAAGAIQLGNISTGGTAQNGTANTFNVALGASNYRIMDADGTIPSDRFTTTPSADGTYVPTLTISSGVATRSWAAPSGGGSTALSLTLAAANWSNNSITVTATGVTASNNVIVSPAPASQSAYTTAGVMCTAQASDSLTFTCTQTPSSDLTVTVLII